MADATKSSSFFEQLKELKEDPGKQAVLAAAKLEDNPDQQEVIASCKVLADNPQPGTRIPLISLFTEYSSDGESLDPGGEVRLWIIGALQPAAVPEDYKIFEKAALTYEFLPPAFKEEAGPLRAAGIAALARVHDELAVYHASRVLVEEFTDPMSGEPALTAARILSNLNHNSSLYQYVMQSPAGSLPEVVSECLSLLISVPVSLVPGLIDRYSESKNDLILAGLFDLLLGHKEGVQGKEFITSFIKDSKKYDAYRYLVALLVAKERRGLLPDLLPIMKFERNKEKIFILLDALDPLKQDPEISKVYEGLRGLNRG